MASSRNAGFEERKSHVGFPHPHRSPPKEHSVGLILLIVVVLLLIGALPRWGHSKNWGYAPTGGLGLVLVIILVLVLMGIIPRGF